MKGGRLRHVLEALQPTRTQDASGGLVTEYTVAGTIRGRVLERGSRERERFGRYTEEVDALIETRQLKGLAVQADWRLRWGAVEYDIVGPFQPQGGADGAAIIAARRRR